MGDDGAADAEVSSANIVVTTMGGESVCRFEVGSRVTGLDIKRQIEELEGTAVHQQRLLTDSGPLTDASELDIVAGSELAIRLVRAPPSKLVTIRGGQGGCVGVDHETGEIKPGVAFQWRMAAIGEGEYTFEVPSGPYAGKFISALDGKPFTKETQLVLAETPETWTVVTSQDRFYAWNRAGPFSMGIRSTRTPADEPGLFWRWQQSHYHLADKKQDMFQGDEAYFIRDEAGSAAILETHTVEP